MRQHLRLPRRLGRRTLRLRQLPSRSLGLRLFQRRPHLRRRGRHRFPHCARPPLNFIRQGILRLVKRPHRRLLRRLRSLPTRLLRRVCFSRSPCRLRLFKRLRRLPGHPLPQSIRSLVERRLHPRHLPCPRRLRPNAFQAFLSGNPQVPLHLDQPPHPCHLLFQVGQLLFLRRESRRLLRKLLSRICQALQRTLLCRLRLAALSPGLHCLPRIIQGLRRLLQRVRRGSGTLPRRRLLQRLRLGSQRLLGLRGGRRCRPCLQRVPLLHRRRLPRRQSLHPILQSLHLLRRAGRRGWQRGARRQPLSLVHSRRRFRRMQRRLVRISIPLTLLRGIQCFRRVRHGRRSIGHRRGRCLRFSLQILRRHLRLRRQRRLHRHQGRQLRPQCIFLLLQRRRPRIQRRFHHRVIPDRIRRAARRNPACRKADRHRPARPPYRRIHRLVRCIGVFRVRHLLQRRRDLRRLRRKRMLIPRQVRQVTHRASGSRLLPCLRRDQSLRRRLQLLPCRRLRAHRLIHLPATQRVRRSIRLRLGFRQRRLGILVLPLRIDLPQLCRH